ncbi:putative toxin-antitoxin system toxin component, PIN family [Fibrobacterales bacterium]|nr:putative toxin-antitoxin system toxin component, PIN family [Fibrobacterales bacterium]
MIKIVIDSNVIFSATFFGGLPQKVLDLVLSEKLVAVVSENIVEEYKRIIKEEVKRVSKFEIDDFLYLCEKISPKTHITICRDTDDNMFLECAIDGKCIYIVSGDKDLLVLKEYEGVKIMTVKQFLDNFEDG